MLRHHYLVAWAKLLVFIKTKILRELTYAVDRRIDYLPCGYSPHCSKCDHCGRCSWHGMPCIDMDKEELAHEFDKNKSTFFLWARSFWG